MALIVVKSFLVAIADRTDRRRDRVDRLDVHGQEFIALERVHYMTVRILVKSDQLPPASEIVNHEDEFEHDLNPLVDVIQHVAMQVEDFSDFVIGVAKGLNEIHHVGQAEHLQPHCCEEEHLIRRFDNLIMPHWPSIDGKVSNDWEVGEGVEPKLQFEVFLEDDLDIALQNRVINAKLVAVTLLVGLEAIHVASADGTVLVLQDFIIDRDHIVVLFHSRK